MDYYDSVKRLCERVIAFVENCGGVESKEGTLICQHLPDGTIVSLNSNTVKEPAGYVSTHDIADAYLIACQLAGKTPTEKSVSADNTEWRPLVVGGAAFRKDGG